MGFPIDAVLDAVSKETRAMLVANPNNPTGTSVSLDGIARITPQGSAAAAAVLIDEAYYEFSGITALPEIESAADISLCAGRSPRCLEWRRCGLACAFLKRSQCEASA